MKWSWRIGSILGIDVFVHVTFVLLLAWVAGNYYLTRRDPRDAIAGVAFIVVLFAIVVLHELGHALAARRYGIRTRDITLLPIGGVARLERMPEDPRQELVVALAGPAVNVALAIGIAATMILAGSPLLGEVELVGGDFLRKLLWINVVLALFNMIPAFPMDGGRVLRALLALRMDYTRATQVAATIGQALALVFGFVGLFTNPFLVFIALFVWMGAAGEASMVQMKSSLAGIPVARAMITEFRSVSPTEPLRTAAQHVLAGFQQDFPVVEDSKVVGVLTRDDLLRAIATEGIDAPIGAVMRAGCEVADPSEMLETVLARLQGTPCRSLPVIRRGELVGMLTLENVGEFMMLQAAVRKARDGQVPAPRAV